MGAREWAAARLVCRHWRANICARVQALDLDLESDGHRWCMVTAAARRLFPKLRSLALLVGARAGPPAEFRRRMEELALVHDVKGVWRAQCVLAAREGVLFFSDVALEREGCGAGSSGAGQSQTQRHGASSCAYTNHRHLAHAHPITHPPKTQS